MHELSIASSICETVSRHTPDGKAVTVVRVEVGPLAGVVPEALESCFELVAQASGLARARLELARLTAAARCPACDARFEVLSMWSGCPRCGHGPVTVAGGRELRVTEIEVEDV